jgi:hypothetical protein
LSGIRQDRPVAALRIDQDEGCMTTPPPAPGSPPFGDPSVKPRWAMPPRLHVGVTFMLQFIAFMVLLGGIAPWLHSSGVHWAIVGPGAALAIVIVHLLIGAMGKLFRVRCTQCRSPSRYQGFGWWPFTYRYVCPQCGNQMKYEVQG